MKKVVSLNFKKIWLVILLLVCIFIPCYSLKADSGYDGSYDSGSFWDLGSSWSSDSSSSSSSSGNGSYIYITNGTDNFFVIFVVSLGFIFLFAILLSIMISENKSKNKVVTNKQTNPLENIPLYNLEELKKVLPDFDEKSFIEKAYKIYKDIQEAWMNADIDTIKKLVTDELYNMYNMQLQTMVMKQEKNIMKDFTFLNYSIEGMSIKESEVSLYVNMKLECFDYIVDKDNKVIRGNDKSKVWYNYLMVFKCGLGESENKCPNCGAVLENTNTSKCPWCHSKIINKNYDWVLSKKMVISQTLNTKENK